MTKNSHRLDKPKSYYKADDYAAEYPEQFLCCYWSTDFYTLKSRKISRKTDFKLGNIVKKCTIFIC